MKYSIMKSLIVGLCFAAIVVANPPKRNQPLKGCESGEGKADVCECCPGLPQVFGLETLKTCYGQINICESSVCLINSFGVTDDTGKFDTAKAIEYVKKTANNDAFQAETIVNDCVKSAPEEVKGIDFLSPRRKCGGTLENFTIIKCIRRNLILTCPTWVKSDKCDKFQAFVKSCSEYPYSIGNLCMGPKKEKKEKEDEERKENKEEKENTKEE